jgi:L-iditol 2-dehydrogenase
MDFGLEDVPMPEAPAGGLLLHVHACGLCGSDLRTLRHGHRKVQFPWIIGHEVSGTVAATGTGYAGEWQVGDLLSVGPLVFCGTCDWCRSGRPEMCEGYREIAQAWPGGFAEYLALPAEAVAHGTIQRVPPGLDPVIAAIAEPISSCLHAQERGGIGQGDSVAVIGAGPIGCTHVSLARTRGASPVIAADVNAARLAMCGEFGCDHVVNAAESELVAEVRRLTSGRGADVVITANAVPETQVQAVEMAAKGGRILLFGGLPKDRACPGINTNLIHYNALTVMGTTIFAPRHHAETLRLLAEGLLPGEKLVTHRFALDEFRAGAEMALEGRVLKAVFLP